jgi:hypothetical protein
MALTDSPFVIQSTLPLFIMIPVQALLLGHKSERGYNRMSAEVGYTRRLKARGLVMERLAHKVSKKHEPIIEPDFRSDLSAWRVRWIPGVISNNAA